MKKIALNFHSKIIQIQLHRSALEDTNILFISKTVPSQWKTCLCCIECSGKRLLFADALHSPQFDVKRGDFPSLSGYIMIVICIPARLEDSRYTTKRGQLSFVRVELRVQITHISHSENACNFFQRMQMYFICSYRKFKRNYTTFCSFEFKFF